MKKLNLTLRKTVDVRSSFLISFYEILIYVLPGGFFVIGIMALCQFKILKQCELIKKIKGDTFLMAVAFFLFSMVINVLSLSTYGIYRAINNGFNYYAIKTEEHRHIQEIKQKAEDLFKVEINDYGQLYDYVSSYVYEKCQTSNSKIERYMGISVLQRNTIIPLVFFSIIILIFLLKSKKYMWFTTTFFISILVIYAFFKFYLVNWQMAIDSVLALFLVTN